MAMDNYNMNDLLLLIVGVSGAGASLCLAIQRSKCKNISFLWGCFRCDRDTDLILKEEKLKLGKTLSNEKDKDKDKDKDKEESKENLNNVNNEPETEQ